VYPTQTRRRLVRRRDGKRGEQEPAHGFLILRRVHFLHQDGVDGHRRRPRRGQVRRRVQGHGHDVQRGCGQAFRTLVGAGYAEGELAQRRRRGLVEALQLIVRGLDRAVVLGADQEVLPQVASAGEELEDVRFAVRHGDHAEGGRQVGRAALEHLQPAVAFLLLDRALLAGLARSFLRARPPMGTQQAQGDAFDRIYGEGAVQEEAAQARGAGRAHALRRMVFGEVEVRGVLNVEDHAQAGCCHAAQGGSAVCRHDLLGLHLVVVEEAIRRLGLVPLCPVCGGNRLGRALAEACRDVD
jgi:hypothetical protein